MPNNPSPLPDAEREHDPAFDPRRARDFYTRLVDLRISAGTTLIDSLCHGVTEIEGLYRECTRLDEVLEHFGRYRHDERRILAAEARRVHTPGETLPVDHTRRPCFMCRKAAASLDLSAVLPPKDAA